MKAVFLFIVIVVYLSVFADADYKDEDEDIDWSPYDHEEVEHFVNEEAKETVGKIDKDQEADFAFMIQDTDFNDKLCGHELMFHIANERKKKNKPVLTLAEIVKRVEKQIKRDDTNGDGLIDYPEFFESYKVHAKAK